MTRLRLRSLFEKSALTTLGLALFTLLMMSVPASAQQMVAVAAKEVNLRAGPGTRYESHWLLSRGYPLRVTARKDGWLKVRDFENDEGWILGRLTGKDPHHVVKASVANVRAAPNARSRVLGTLGYGEVVRTVERRQGWVKVRHQEGLTGWIARRLLWGW